MTHVELEDRSVAWQRGRRFWADRQRWRLEDKLGDVLEEILHEFVTGRSSRANSGLSAGPTGSTTGPASGGSIIGMSASRAIPSPVTVPSGATPDGDGIVVGTGPVDVEAYIDFGCPFCRQFELMSQLALDRLLADRLISFVRHPMDFLDAVSTTAYSTRAAAASAAAADAGFFHDYARTLFANQPPEGGAGLTDGQLVELGQAIGITDPQFPETIRQGRYLPWPPYVTQRATQRGVAGTPSVFVRGAAVPARPGPIAAAVEAALASPV